MPASRSLLTIYTATVAGEGGILFRREEVNDRKATMLITNQVNLGITAYQNAGV